MSQYDTQSLHDFLLHTPEGDVRKMLNDQKNMTDVHCNLLLKIVRATKADVFGTHFEKQDFPRVRMSPAEEKIKEKFWNNCVATLTDRGLLQPATGTKAAA